MPNSPEVVREHGSVLSSNVALAMQLRDGFVKPLFDIISTGLGVALAAYLIANPPESQPTPSPVSDIISPVENELEPNSALVKDEMCRTRCATDHLLRAMGEGTRSALPH